MSNRIQEAFDQIHAEEELKERTRRFLENALETQANTRRGSRTLPHAAARRSTYTRLAAGMAVFALVLGISGWIYLTPVSAISLEINPCIELGINRFDRVVSVASYNDDGAKLALGLSVKNKNYAEAVDLILADTTIAGLLADDELMEVTVVCDDYADSSRLLAGVEDCTSHTENVSCHTGNSAEAAEAHTHGLSLAKYRAYLELRDLDAAIAPEDVQDMTMRQIRDLIQSLGASPDSMPPETSGSYEEDSECYKEDSECHEEESERHEEETVHHGEGMINNNGQNQNGTSNGSGNGAGNGSGNGAGNASGNGAGNGSGNGSGNGHHGNGHH